MATRKAAKRSSSRAKVATKHQSIALMLNGQAVGQMTLADAGSKTVGEVANSIAKDHGLKSYSILVNGVKASTEDAGKALAGNQSIEVFAKETRG